METAVIFLPKKCRIYDYFFLPDPRAEDIYVNIISLNYIFIQGAVPMAADAAYRPIMTAGM